MRKLKKIDNKYKTGSFILLGFLWVPSVSNALFSIVCPQNSYSFLKTSHSQMEVISPSGYTCVYTYVYAHTHIFV